MCTCLCMSLTYSKGVCFSVSTKEVGVATHHSVSLALFQHINHLPGVGGRVNLNFELCHVPSEGEGQSGRVGFTGHIEDRGQWVCQ